METSLNIRELIDLIKWDLQVNPIKSFDNFRAFFLLIELRVEQYIYQRFFKSHGKARFFYQIYRIFGAFFQWILCSSNIPGSVAIGKGLRIVHPQNIIIFANTEIGEFCTIFQNVSIVWNGFKKSKPSSPKIGSRVLIGTGAIIVGDVSIGSDVLIGAGALVTRSVPDHSRVLSEPAKITPWHPTEDASEPGSERHLCDPYSIWR